MAIEKVREYFEGLGLGARVREFAVSSATVELAAQAVGCEPAHIAKTLSFAMGDGCILIVTAGDRKIDNGKFKARFGCKAKMLPAEDVERLTGHQVGGVCPFASNPAAKVYTDVSLQRFETVYPAAGSANSAVELSCDELFRYSNSEDWVDVCK